MNFGIFRPGGSAQPQQQHQTQTPIVKVEHADRSQQQLSDFMLQIEDYNPTVPDAVIAHYLNSAGFESSDPRIVRLIALATQKFISDVANDALHHCRTRTNGSSQPPVQNAATLPLSGGGGGGNKGNNKSNKDRKLTCTVDDVAPALADYGITVRKVHYFS